MDSTDAEQWACPECDSFFSTAAALKIHAQRAHGWTHKPFRIFDRSKHAVHGLPTCRFCEKRFSRWQTLEQHINSLACPKMLVLQAAGEGNDPGVAMRSIAPAAGEKRPRTAVLNQNRTHRKPPSGHLLSSSRFDRQLHEVFDISYQCAVLPVFFINIVGSVDNGSLHIG